MDQTILPDLPGGIATGQSREETERNMYVAFMHDMNVKHPYNIAKAQHRFAERAATDSRLRKLTKLEHF